MERPVICLKIGGASITNDTTLDLLLKEIADLKSEYKFALVHGGGAEVSNLSRQFGIEPVFDKGVRVTSNEEMDIVDMVLSGKMNKRLVRKLVVWGVDSMGLTGSDGALFMGNAVGSNTRTGRISSVNKHLINLVIDGGWVPVIASTSMDVAGQPLNINADEVALAIASRIPASMLVFISDIRGILKHDTVIRKITPGVVRKEIESGVISGGMIPKVQSSILALEDGVRSVIIGDFREPGDLRALIAGSLGTKICKEI